MTKLFNYQILADRFVLNLKMWKTQGPIFPVDIVLLVMKSWDFCQALGPHPIMNMTLVHCATIATKLILNYSLAQGLIYMHSKL